MVAPVKASCLKLLSKCDTTCPGLSPDVCSPAVDAAPTSTDDGGRNVDEDDDVGDDSDVVGGVVEEEEEEEEDVDDDVTAGEV